jgi:hypothetical protein
MRAKNQFWGEFMARHKEVTPATSVFLLDFLAIFKEDDVLAFFLRSS